MKRKPPVNTQAPARAIMADGLGQAELEFVLSLTAPPYCNRQGPRYGKP